MQAATIEVKRYHGKMEVRVTGRTGRGQSFIKDRRVLNIDSMSDPKFKPEMTAAVKEMLGSEAYDAQYGLDIPNTGG